MEGGARTRLAVVVVVVIAAVALVPLALGGGDDEAAKPAPGLRVERSGSAVELIVYVKPGDNVAATAGGARSVMLRCVDAAGRLVHAQEEAWPFGGSDPLAGGPHAHVPLDPATMNEVSSCRLVGTKPVLEGAVR